MLDISLGEALAVNFPLQLHHTLDEGVAMTNPRDELLRMIKSLFQRDPVNIIACDGKERVERHEIFGKWKSRFTMAGFRQYPLSSYVNSVIRSLLRCYSEHYMLVETDGYAVGMEGQDSGISICLALIHAIWKEGMER
ncbi:hypothetical protein ACH5RR_027974 [Cinchona calisaya]|uniref:Uncharacterized protein n=1 Tax=Cinchona calisaya TaxID=153742 RepID=A0ABD2YMG2_9GENT